ncbi:ESCRT-0 subunit protein hse1 [Entophlyctis luteolus]|nr:ESCRT-0 subunit protein hse1 [Entophlyctis luteolus]
MDALVQQATDPAQTRENWALYVRICEQCERSPENARDAVQAIARRLAHKNANAALFSLTLANCLVQNTAASSSGTVLREISSKVLVDALAKQLTSSAVHRAVRARIAELLAQWEAVYSVDQRHRDMGQYLLDAISGLRRQGVQFPVPTAKPDGAAKTPAQRAAEQEKEELELALALSLSAQQQQEQDSRKIQRNIATFVAPPSAATHKPICRARALYDFAGAEEGELRLAYGDIIDVHDDTTFQEWWKGEINGRVGIFPSNYVERIEEGVSAPSAAGTAPSTSATSPRDIQNIEKFVGLLANASPRDNLTENAKIQELHHSILMMRPKLLSELETRKAKQDELVTLNERFAAACATYHRLMDESMAAQRAAYQTGYGSGYGQYPPYQQQGFMQPPQQQQYYAPMPPQQYPQQQYSQYQQPAPQQGYYQQ